MKKRFLLAVLPALLVLSSCGLQPKVEAEPQFEEDTLAHDDLFREADGALLYKGNINKADPIDYTLDPYPGNRPSIGIQTYEEGNTISIRFVAAIKVTGNLSEATAVWTRAMYKPDGSIYKDFAEMPCQKVYTTINNHGAEQSISAFNGQYETKYDYFVVYTLRGINKASFADYYLNAYLTLGDGSQSKVLATKVNYDYYALYAFEPSQRYFLRGQINGEQQDIAQDATTQGNNPEHNYASFSTVLTDCDEFVIVANDVANKRFKIYDASCLTGDVSNFAFSNVNGKFKANLTENFVLYLNKDGELWTSVSGQHYQLFVGDVLSPIESAIISGYETDKAVFSGVAIENDNTSVKVRLNGTQVGASYSIAYSGYYTVGLNSGNSVFANADYATVTIRVDCTNKGDVTAWGGKVFIVGPFCDWSTTNDNAIMLTETSSGSKIWTGSISLQYGSSFVYKVRLNDEAGTWGNDNNWYPSDNQTFIPKLNETSISVTW